MRVFKGIVALACSVGLAAGAVVGVSGAASAAVTNYDIALQMVEGDGTTPFTVTGSFSFDPAACGSSPCPDAYTNVAISVPVRPYSGLPAITYTDADICPTAGGGTCSGQPQSGAGTLSLAAVPGIYFQALIISFAPTLTQANPNIDLPNSSAYSETGDATTTSGTLTDTTPAPTPTPTPVAQVPTAGSVTVPAKLRLRGTKKIESATCHQCGAAGANLGDVPGDPW